MRWSWLVVAAVLGLNLAQSVAASGSAQRGPCAARASAGRYRHIVVIAFENHSYREILGRNAPANYFKTLAARCGSTSAFTAVAFPRSLPNYLAATGGTTASITGDCLPGRGCVAPGQSIFEQVGGRHWRIWAQSMPRPCYPLNTRLYVPRHAPAVYYPRIRRPTCRADMVPLPSQPPTPRRQFIWIAPNLNQDMHNGSISNAATWLHTFLAGPHGLLRSSLYRRGHTAIFIWWDSAGAAGSIRTPIPLIVVGPSVGHRQVRVSLNDYALLDGWEHLLGVGCLANACEATRGFNRRFNLHGGG